MSAASLKATIILTASYYGRTLSPEILGMYVDDLSDLPTEAVIEAYTTYRRNPKNVHFPLPAQIRGLVSPTVDADEAAREIAALISGAIVKHGWCNAQEARKAIGEVGWSIVERQGGWMHLCQNHGVTIDPTAFQAQVREQAKAALKHTPESLAKAIGVSSSSKPGLLSAREILAGESEG